MVAIKQPFVISGPSGCGKSTLLNKLFKKYPDTFGFSVSHTTRSPRAGEVPDVSYHFVPKEDFIALKDANGFIETACFSGNMYGTSKAAVEAVTSQNRICVLDVEIQGVRSIKKTDMNAIYVFISPPSFEVLEERLRGRKTETEESIAKRMEAARHDLKAANDEKLFDIYITNDELERALQDLEAFLISKYGDLSQVN